MLTIQNQASQMYAWSETNRTMKYNPKVYLSVQESVGTIWLYHFENDSYYQPSTWPESFYVFYMKIMIYLYSKENLGII